MGKLTDLEISEASIGPLAWLTLRGPRDQVFWRLGHTYRHVIQEFLAGAEERTRVGRMKRSQRVFGVLEATQRLLPGPMSELEAIAEGAEVPFEELQLLNIRGDVGYQSDGCSDLGLRAPTSLLLAHNEDADPVHEGDCPLVTLLVDEELPITTYWYPGMLPAMTFWLNGAEIACGIDHIPVTAPGEGVGRQFLARYLSGTASLAEFVDRARSLPVAGGYTYMVGSARERELLTVEVGPSGVASMRVAQRYAHTNHFLELLDPMVIDAQSGPRLETLNTLDAPVTREQALRAFSDPARGVWRDATGGDPLLTLCSVVFDLHDRVVMLQPRGDTASHELRFEEFTPRV